MQRTGFERFNMAISKDLLLELKDWRHANHIDSMSEAARLLMRKGLDADRKEKWEAAREEDEPGKDADT